MVIRDDFSSASQLLTRLSLYGREFGKNNNEVWHLFKKDESYKQIYPLDSVYREKFEAIYGRGRDLAFTMSYQLNAFNEVDQFPTLTSYISSFYYQDSFANIENLKQVSKQASQKKDELKDCPSVVEEMIELFDQQISLLENVFETVELLKTTDIYKIENGIEVSGSNHFWDRRKVELVLNGIQEGRFKQEEISRTLDAIRRVLQHMLDQGSDMDHQYRQKLNGTKEIIDGNFTLTHKVEATLPLIPGILSYKIEAGVEGSVNFQPLLNDMIDQLALLLEDAKK